MSFNQFLGASTFFISDFHIDQQKLKEKVQKDIDRCVDDYWNVVRNFPRKLKKRKKKELQTKYNVLMWMRDYDPIAELMK